MSAPTTVTATWTRAQPSPSFTLLHVHTNTHTHSISMVQSITSWKGQIGQKLTLLPWHQLLEAPAETHKHTHAYKCACTRVSIDTQALFLFKINNKITNIVIYIQSKFNLHGPLHSSTWQKPQHQKVFRPERFTETTLILTDWLTDWEI